MRKKVIKISKPGISKGKRLLGFRYLGNKFENALHKLFISMSNSKSMPKIQNNVA